MRRNGVNRFCLFALLTGLASLVGSCQNIVVDDDDVLSVPGNFKAAVDGANSLAVNLEWTAAAGVTYTVYWRRDATTLTKENATGSQAGLNVNQFSLGNLHAGYAYAFAVAAVSGSEQSDLSEVKTLTITGPALSAPVISLAAGTYAGDQSVTMTSVDSGVTIVYTLNGSEPSRESSVYDPAVPIGVIGTTTLKARAFMPDWHSVTDSAVASADYKVADVWLLVTGTVQGYEVLKNGSSIYNPDSDSSLDDMQVLNDIIFLAGRSGAGPARASLWRSDEGTSPLAVGNAAGNSYANALFVGENIYIAGQNHEDKACFWKVDGGGTTETVLDEGLNTSALDITFSGSTVYVGGMGYDAAETANVGCLWTQTGSNPPSDPTFIVGADDPWANQVAFDGSRAMLAGYAHPGIVCYWNMSAGNSIALTAMGTPCSIGDAVLDGGSWHLAGSISNCVTVWSVNPVAHTASTIGLHPAGMDYDTQGLAIDSDQGALFVSGTRSTEGAEYRVFLTIQDGSTQTWTELPSTYYGVYAIQATMRP